MTENLFTELILLQDEYINFCNNCTAGPVNVAYTHGWKPAQEDIQKGREYRKKIVKLKTKLKLTGV